MSYPRPPGGKFPLTTAPTGNTAGGLYPTTDRLVAAIRSLAPTAYWRLGDASGLLLDTAQPSATTITLATSADADDIVDTVENHGFVTGDTFSFATLTGGSNVTAGTTYFVIATSLAAKTFKFATTAGGSAVDFGSDITAGTIVRAAPSFWNAAVTGSPTYGVAAPSPIGQGITWSGTGQYATTATSIPTPSASVSVVALFATTNASASARALAGRTAASQSSWELRLSSSHTVVFNPMQSGGSSHASAAVSGATNDGLWHVAGGTYDGTTVRTYRDTATASSTTLTGSWHTASTAAISLASYGTGDVYPGSLAHVAYWADRVLTAPEFLFLNAIAKGA